MTNNPGAVSYKEQKVKIINGKPVAIADDSDISRDDTITYKILGSHRAGHGKSGPDGAELKLKFDALISHDITYVSIIQTARSAGLTSFPVPYVLTNCHNSLCAVGGTINEDDHAFGLSAAIKYGGIYVPANQAVIHQYARETLTGCGKMILGSDSHTRYGCFGTLGFGEGGGELVRQLLGHTYDIAPPEVVLVWLEGAPGKGVGPHDVALAIIKEVFPQGKVKNKILEFAGPGIKSLPMDFRAGIDVMTTETSCLSSVWETDSEVEEFYRITGRDSGYKELKITDGACYGSLIEADLSKIEPMIALPFHPSKAFTIHELQNDADRIFKQTQEECNAQLETGGSSARMDLTRCIDSNGQVIIEQGIIVGCAGGLFDNIAEASDILRGKSIGNGFFDLSVYPSSTPISLAIAKHGIAQELMLSGAVIKNAFCGPCFGAGDTPGHGTLSARHATRNFAGREGSKPSQGQMAATALMDARSIAATAAAGGILTAAADIDYDITKHIYHYDGSIYEKRCYNGFGKPDAQHSLRLGPNITDWPRFEELKEDLLLTLCAIINDDVTTTDELIPSGETSSYRSNPVALAEHTLSRRVPGYAAMSKAEVSPEGIEKAGAVIAALGGDIDKTTVGTCIFARKPGDGSAREQAASCQRVLGGRANICFEYATKRYRSNCINWGIIPFTIERSAAECFMPGDRIYVKGMRSALLAGEQAFQALVIAKSGREPYDITLRCGELSDEHRAVIAEGCLMNYYNRGNR